MGNKINKIKLLIEKSDLDAVLISSVSNIVYLTDYCGFSYFEREAFLVITGKANYLITDGRYSEAVSDISGFELLEVSSTRRLEHIFKYLSEEKKIKKIGIDENNITIAENKKLKKYFRAIPVPDLKNLRIIKDEDEISKIEKACKLGDEAFDFILKKLKLGVTEKQIAFEIEFFIRKRGVDISFPPIVAFGKNSSIPHHQPTNNELITHSPVLLDFGVRYQNYCSDMTRTVFFGKADGKFKKMYNTVLTAQQKAIDLLKWSMINGKSSIKASDVDKVVRSHIISQGFPTIPHSLVHGIGIDVHEPPRLSPKSKDILKEGMVFSIEPGIYLPGSGGVRIEDLVLLEEKGLILLTHSSKEIIEI